MRGIGMSDRAMREMDAMFRNDIEARDLLNLVAAEFASDPMSVQCFDLRLVERVKLWAAREKNFRRI